MVAAVDWDLHWRLQIMSQGSRDSNNRSCAPNLLSMQPSNISFIFLQGLSRGKRTGDEERDTADGSGSCSAQAMLGLHPGGCPNNWHWWSFQWFVRPIKDTWSPSPNTTMVKADIKPSSYNALNCSLSFGMLSMALPYIVNNKHSIDTAEQTMFLHPYENTKLLVPNKADKLFIQTLCVLRSKAPKELSWNDSEPAAWITLVTFWEHAWGSMIVLIENCFGQKNGYTFLKILLQIVFGFERCGNCLESMISSQYQAEKFTCSTLYNEKQNNYINKVCIQA